MSRFRKNVAEEGVRARRWGELLSQRGRVTRVNTALLASLVHCPTLETLGESFRCIECHVASGTHRKGDETGWHRHGEHQLEIPLSGSFLFEADGGGRVLLGSGQALIIPAGTVHRWRCVRTGPIVGISLDRLGRGDGPAPARFETVALPAIRTSVEALILGAMEKMPAALHSKALASRLFLLLAEIFASFPSERPVPQAGEAVGGDIRGRESVGRVIAHLEEHYSGPIRVERLADEVGMSCRHLHRLFLHHVGKSVHDHLLDLRLEHARQLLMEKGRVYLIKEIASRCGFGTAAHFVSVFGKAFGISPLNYRAARGGGRRIFTVYLRRDRKADG